MNKEALLFIKDDDIALLSSTAAEMLAMPHLWCPHRACRRDHTCDRAFPSGEPACVTYLPPDMRALYDQFLEIVVYIADNIRHPHPASDPDISGLEEAAIEVIHAARDSRPKMAPHFDEWLRLHRKPEDIERNPSWRSGREPLTYGAPKAGYESTDDDEPLNLRENRQHVVPDHAALDDWRNYK